MFSPGLVRPDARISHSRCRPAVPIDGKTEREFCGFFILWNINIPFSHHFPPFLFCTSFSIFYLLLFVCDYWRDFDENERGTKQVLRDPSDSAGGPRQAPSTATVSQFNTRHTCDGVTFDAIKTICDLVAGTPLSCTGRGVS